MLLTSSYTNHSGQTGTPLSNYYDRFLRTSTVSLSTRHHIVLSSAILPSKTFVSPANLRSRITVRAFHCSCAESLSNCAIITISLGCDERALLQVYWASSLSLQVENAGRAAVGKAVQKPSSGRRRLFRCLLESGLFPAVLHLHSQFAVEPLWIFLRTNISSVRYPCNHLAVPIFFSE